MRLVGIVSGVLAVAVALVVYRPHDPGEEAIREAWTDEMVV